MRARAHHGGVVEPSRSTEAAKRVDAVGWGLFFVWIGIALVTGISFGIGLLGVAVITLGMQVVRRVAGLEVERFWLAAGLVFLLGSLWVMLNIGVDLVPILLIVLGAALLISAFRARTGAEGTRR